MKIPRRRQIVLFLILILPYSFITRWCATQIPRVRRAHLNANRPQCFIGFSPNGKWLATAPKISSSASENRFSLPIQLWDPRSGKLVATIPDVSKLGKAREYANATFSPSGNYLAISDLAGLLHVYDLRNHNEKLRLNLKNDLCSVRFSQESESIYVANSQRFHRFDLTGDFVEETWDTWDRGLLPQAPSREAKSFVPCVSKEHPCSELQLFSEENIILFRNYFCQYFELFEWEEKTKSFRKSPFVRHLKSSLSGKQLTVKLDVGERVLDLRGPAIETVNFAVDGISTTNSEGLFTFTWSPDRSRILAVDGPNPPTFSESPATERSSWKLNAGSAEMGLKWISYQTVVTKDLAHAFCAEPCFSSSAQLQFSLVHRDLAGNQRHELGLCSQECPHLAITSTGELGMHSLIGVWPPETSPIINWSKLVEKINKASGIQVLPEIPPRMIPQTHIWDLVTRKKIFHLPNAYCLAISADDATMATQTESYDIELWDIPPRRNWFFAMALAILPTMLITFLAYFLTRHIRFAFTRVAALFQSIRIAK